MISDRDIATIKVANDNRVKAGQMTRDDAIWQNIALDLAKSLQGFIDELTRFLQAKR